MPAHRGVLRMKMGHMESPKMRLNADISMIQPSILIAPIAFSTGGAAKGPGPDSALGRQ